MVCLRCTGAPSRIPTLPQERERIVRETRRGAAGRVSGEGKRRPRQPLTHALGAPRQALTNGGNKFRIKS